jgi:hypothetical protein
MTLSSRPDEVGLKIGVGLWFRISSIVHAEILDDPLLSARWAEVLVWVFFCFRDQGLKGPSLAGRLHCLHAVILQPVSYIR